MLSGPSPRRCRPSVHQAPRTLSLTLVLCLSVGVGPCWSGPALAAMAETSPTRIKVQGYLDVAAGLNKAGDFEGALDELRRAQTIEDLAVIRYNIARCYEQLNRYADAAQAYRSYLEASDSWDGAPDRLKKAKEAVVRFSALGEGELEISCSVPGARIVIPGLTSEPVRCPLVRPQVRPGSYEIRVTAPERLAFTTTVEVIAGARTVVAAENPAAAIQEAPKEREPTPQPEPMPASFVAQHPTTGQPGGSSLNPPPVAQPEPGPTRVWKPAGVALLGAGIALAAGGAGCHVASQLRADEANRLVLEGTDYDAYASAKSSANELLVGAGVLYGVGGAAALIGLLLLVVPEGNAASTPPISLEPIPGGAMVSLTGQF